MDVLIFGTGKTFEGLKFSRKVNIVAFLDNNEAKIGTTLRGAPVVHPRDVHNFRYDYIILASNFYHVMGEQLKSYGINEEVLVPVYLLAQKDKARNLGIIGSSISAEFRGLSLNCVQKVFSVCAHYFKRMRLRNNYIVYICHWGQKYNCNPKAIYEYLIYNKPDYKHIWVFGDLKLSKPVPSVPDGKARFVKYKTLRYLYYLCVSKYWIINVNPPKKTDIEQECASLLRPETTVLQTWHAAGAFKKFGVHIGAENFRYDHILCSSEAVRDIYAEALCADKNSVKTIGLPRADVLVKRELHQEIRSQVCLKYAMDSNKKTLLYAPTFRDSPDFKLQFSLERMRDILGPQWQIMLRFHHEIKSSSLLESLENFVFDVSEEDDANPFLILADALVTDYSSIVFEYALLDRPIIFYAYDLDSYIDVRKFYFGYEGFVPGPIAKTEEELYALLEDIGEVHEKYGEQISDFANKYMSPSDGNACRRVVELLGL